MKAAEIEIAVAEYFGIRQHLIVPNVSWGFGFSHEIDMLIVTGSGYASEIEIKVSKSDLKRDRKKRKWKTGMYSEFGDIYQTHNTIKSLYFAIPKELESAISEIPERAGILIVGVGEYDKSRLYAWELRKPQINKDARKLNEKELLHLARLGTMRIWGLKRKLLEK